MMRRLYALAMTLAQPLLRRRLARRGLAEPGYLEAIEERFGRYTVPVAAPATTAGKANPASAVPDAPLQDGSWVWVHAVSLGETRAAAVLLAALRQHLPGLRLLLTHGTATGRAEGRALLRPGDQQVWQPWDAPGAVNRFLHHFQPRIGILMETEVWPNLTAACRARKLPLLLVNARLSERSLAKALRLAWLARPAYSALAAVYAQTQADAARLQQLGAPVHGVFGNLKFDAQPDAAVLARGRQWRADWESAPHGPAKAVILFAVSREGEEALLLQRLATLPPAQRQAVQWLIVPRHPQRFDEVAALVLAEGFTLSRRSQWLNEGPNEGPPHSLQTGLAADPAAAADVWLGDSLGEMPLYYALADVALLGGSFLPLGGQNLIEAAACGCPVVMGPHTFNFAEAAANSAAAGAAFGVADMPQGVAKALDLLQQPKRLAQASQAGESFLVQHKGAAEKTAAAIARRV